MPSLRPAPLQDPPAAGCPHAGAKSMHPLSGPLLGLKCALHAAQYTTGPGRPATSPSKHISFRVGISCGQHPSLFTFSSTEIPRPARESFFLGTFAHVVHIAPPVVHRMFGVCG